VRCERACAYGGGTVINAIATGFGAAFPISLRAYMSRDGELCVAVSALPEHYCARDGAAIRKVKLDLEFKRLELHRGEVREVYRPKDLLAFAAGAREYVRIL
jgi:hypothetical protein